MSGGFDESVDEGVLVGRRGEADVVCACRDDRTRDVPAEADVGQAAKARLKPAPSASAAASFAERRE